MSTKDKIIAVLADLLKQDENISDISISKIAALADIGKSTVYEHFTSKDELIGEAYRYLSSIYQKRIIAPLKHNTFEKAFKEIATRMISNAKEASDIMMCILNEGYHINMMAKEDMNDIMLNVQGEIEKLYIEIIQMGVKEGIIKPIITETVEKGHVIRALTVGLIMQCVNEHIELSDEDALNYLYKYTVLILNA